MPLINDWAKKRVEEVLQLSSEAQKSYRSEIKGLGGMILQNGLFGTIAYYKVKRNRESERRSSKALELILAHIEGAVIERIGIDRITEMEPIDDTTYMRAQESVVDATKWLRRYADILIATEGEDDE